MTDGRPEWDEERVLSMIGARVLIGVTHHERGGPRQEQMFGTIVSVNARSGFQVTLEGTKAGQTYWIPPHLDAFKLAPPGEYRLRATGEVVKNPDFITTWSVNPPSTH